MNSFLFLYVDPSSGEVRGPITHLELSRLCFAEEISPETKVALEGSEKWENFGDIDQLISEEFERRAKKEELRMDTKELASYIEYTKELIDKSYLELSPEKRANYYEAIQSIAKTLKTRSLFEEEIEFLKAWIVLKDKDLGESLLAKEEMNRIQEIKGTGSSNSVIKWMGLVAAGQMLSRQHSERMEFDLDRLADGIVGEDDVEDSGDGGDGEGFGEFM